MTGPKVDNLPHIFYPDTPPGVSYKARERETGENMDLTLYYQKIRETKATLQEKDVVLISLETGDGGQAGVCTEVPASVAAKMIVDGVAEIAPRDVADEFLLKQAEAKEQADREMSAAQVPMAVVPVSLLNRRQEARDPVLTRPQAARDQE
jgi:hypothetical protein